jgi:hypothetical protein
MKLFVMIIMNNIPHIHKYDDNKYDDIVFAKESSSLIVTSYCHWQSRVI